MPYTARIKRLIGVQRLKLAAQVLDMAVYGAVSYHAVIIIKLIEQLLAGKDFAWLQRQCFQQAELRRRQLQRRSSPAGLKAASSISSSDACCASSGDLRTRRRIVFTRATTSRGLNGLQI